MANVFQFVDWVTNESLRSLLNKLEVADKFNTSFEREYDREFAVGETVRIKLPQRFTVADGFGYQPQPINRRYTTVSVNQPFQISFEADSIDLALKMERGEEWFKDQYLDKAIEQMAQEIDSRAALFAYQNTSNYVGVLGTTPTSIDTYHAARQRLIEQGVPPGDLYCIVPPKASRSLANNINNLFNPAPEISRLFKRGSLGMLAGMEWLESMSLYSHTAGTWAGAVTANGAGQSGSQITITNTSGDTFNVGDIISFANVNAVNPGTRRSTGTLKQFVVTQALVGTGAGTDVLNIYPAIDGPGSQYQNVDSLPANGAALTLWPGTAAPNGKVGTNGLVLHKDAFALVGVRLYEPKAVEMAKSAQDKKTGVSISFVKAFDPVQRKVIVRLDCLLGFGQLYADNAAVRIANG